MKKNTRAPALLALSDGTVFSGFAFGAHHTKDAPAVGELVFNTSMFGYQEILTDPSYAGQIITFTYPHIGNVGCNEEDNESKKIHASGLIIRELSQVVSNFRATTDLSSYLSQAGVMGISQIDTRKLVNHIRNHGSQMSAMAVGDSVDVATLVDHAKAMGSMEGKDYVKHVSCAEPYSWNEGVWSLERFTTKGTGYAILREETLSQRPHVIAVDCGIKRNILRLLADVGFRITVVPATYSSSQIIALRPDALFISNGPGDPATLTYVVKTVRELVGSFPLFGICLGHQILGQVFGASTYKLKFGHRGGNHPVKDLTTNKVEITVQNHGFAIREKELRSEVDITHVNLNDQTNEGISSKQTRAFSVQYHPESSPGPHDARYLFRRFYELVVSG